MLIKKTPTTFTENGIASIYSHNKEDIVGTGFAITAKHIISCAHVINEALGRDLNEHSQPDQETFITLSLPLAGDQKLENELSARVIVWQPRQIDFPEIDDIVILELNDSSLVLPTPQVVQLGLNDYFDQRPFKIFGFNVSEGSWTHGRIAGRTADHSIQLNMQGHIAHGFSGAPVWDKEERGIIGMMVAMREPMGTAYMIPLSRLLAAWPEMGKTTLLRNPYRGLAVFEERHQSDFYGREVITEELLGKVGSTPFLLLVGTSGSGKSSILNAGLIAKLRSDDEWLLLKTRPADAPLERLAKTLVNEFHPQSDLFEQDDKYLEWTEKLEKQAPRLGRICEQALAQSTQSRLLLIVDQFEELYTHTADPVVQQQYIDQLLSLLETDSITLLISVRADFIARLVAYKPFAKSMNQYSEHQMILSGMNTNEVEAAITEPSHALGVRFETGLVERILDELQKDNEGQLPLLEFTLTELWQRQQNRMLTHEAFTEIGGIRQSLALHAERVFTDSELQHHKSAVERIMVQLIVPGLGTEDTRQIARYDHFSTEDQVLLPILANHRLIITGTDVASGAETVEVIHEALIREWKTLQSWMMKHREFRIWQNHLRERITGWEAHNRVDEELLRGRYLLEALDYVGLRALMLSEPDRQFIELSVKVEKVQRWKRQSVRATFTGLIGIVAAVAIWQWQLALGAESKALEAVDRAQEAEQFAQQETEKVTQSKNEANKLIRAVMESLPSKGKPVDYNEIDKTFKSLTQSSFNSADTLYSNALLMQRAENYDRAEDLFERSLELDETAACLDCLANFMAYIRGNHDRAEELYKQAIAADPQLAQGLNNYANFMTGVRGNHDRAEQLYEQAIIADPKFAAALSNFGHFMVNTRKNNERAEKLYEQAVAADPEYAPALSNFAIFMSNVRKDYDRAEKLHEQAIEADPSYVYSLSNLAYLISNTRGNHDRAEQLYERATEADPKNVENLNRYAIFMSEIRKNHDRAEQLYEQAVAADPKDADTLDRFAVFMTTTQKNHNRAQQLFEQAIAANSKDPKNLKNFAFFMSSVQKNHDRAEQLYEQAISIDSKDAEILGSFASFMTNIQKDHDRAEQLFEQSIAANPRDVKGIRNFAVFMENTRGNYNRAEQLYKQGITADPKDAEILGSFAIFLKERKKDYTQAEKYFRMALIINPSATCLGCYATFMHHTQKKYKQAEKLYEQAIAADPKNARVLENFAYLMTHNRPDHDRAQELYEQAITADPKNAGILIRYASFMTDTRNDHDQAERLYERAIAVDPSDIGIINVFINFMTYTQMDHDRLEKLYKQAISVDPKDAMRLGNYAQLLLAKGDVKQGEKQLNLSFENNSGRLLNLDLQIWFLRLAHLPEKNLNALTKIIQLLKQGIRSWGWDLSRNIEQAKKQKYPNITLLKALADVISMKAEFETLKPFLKKEISAALPQSD